MSARIVLDLLPSGTPGRVNLIVTSEVPGDDPLTAEEIIFTLEQTIEGMRSGAIVPVGGDDG